MNIPDEEWAVPLFRLPEKEEMILRLLHEELQAAKFMARMHHKGYDTGAYELELGYTILSVMGFNCSNGLILDWYYDKVEEYSKKADVLSFSLATRQAVFDFYLELQIKRRSEVGHGS